MSDDQSETFSVGLSKSETSKLVQALQRLGFGTKDCMDVNRYVAGDLTPIGIAAMRANVLLAGTPIPNFCRELDARLPGSKFTHTVRDRDGRVQSRRKQFNQRFAANQPEAHKRLFEDLCATDVCDEQRFAGGYERFVVSVLNAFKGRPHDLPVMNAAAGDGWDRLCPFLGRPVPDTPVPKGIVTLITRINIDALVAATEAAGRELRKRYKGSVERPFTARKPSRSAEVGNLLKSALDNLLRRSAMGATERAACKRVLASLSRPGTEIPSLPHRRIHHLMPSGRTGITFS